MVRQRSFVPLATCSHPEKIGAGGRGGSSRPARGNMSTGIQTQPPDLHRCTFLRNPHVAGGSPRLASGWRGDQSAPGRLSTNDVIRSITRRRAVMAGATAQPNSKPWSAPATYRTSALLVAATSLSHNGSAVPPIGSVGDDSCSSAAAILGSFRMGVCQTPGRPRSAASGRTIVPKDLAITKC